MAHLTKSGTTGHLLKNKSTGHLALGCGDVARCTCIEMSTLMASTTETTEAASTIVEFVDSYTGAPVSSPFVTPCVGQTLANFSVYTSPAPAHDIVLVFYPGASTGSDINLLVTFYADDPDPMYPPIAVAGVNYVISGSLLTPYYLYLDSPFAPGAVTNNRFSLNYWSVDGGPTPEYTLQTKCPPCETVNFSDTLVFGDTPREVFMSVAPGQVVYPWIIATNYYIGPGCGTMTITSAESGVVLWSQSAYGTNVGTGIVGVDSCLPLTVPVGTLSLVVNYAHCNTSPYIGDATFGIDCTDQDCNDAP